MASSVQFLVGQPCVWFWPTLAVPTGTLEVAVTF